MTEYRKVVNYGESGHEHTIEERALYGVAAQDTWGLDSYLVLVFMNSLRMLADNSHGWPCGDDFPEFEDWITALNDTAGKLEKWYDRHDRHIEFHDTFDWPVEEPNWERLDNGNSLYNPSPEYSAVVNEWSKQCDEYDDQVRIGFEEALDWIKKYWDALWD